MPSKAFWYKVSFFNVNLSAHRFTFTLFFESAGKMSYWRYSMRGCFQFGSFSVVKIDTLFVILFRQNDPRLRWTNDVHRWLFEFLFHPGVLVKQPTSLRSLPYHFQTSAHGWLLPFIYRIINWESLNTLSWSICISKDNLRPMMSASYLANYLNKSQEEIMNKEYVLPKVWQIQSLLRLLNSLMLHQNITNIILSQHNFAIWLII